jgi:hypothetical protein
MKVKVFHANRMPDGYMYDAHFHGAPPAYPAECKLVAEVEVPEESCLADACEEAFRLTNHIDCPWWDNEGVTRHGPETRSTSVGDVVVVGSVAFRVASFGFNPEGGVA